MLFTIPENQQICLTAKGRFWSTSSRPEQSIIADSHVYSPFFGNEHPPQNQEDGPNGVGDKVPKVGLSLWDKPLMGFIGDSECDHAHKSEAHASSRLGRLIKRSIQKNAQDAKFTCM